MKGYDRGIIVATLLLCLFGVIMVFSASSIYALKEYGTKYYFVRKQVLYLVIGIMAGGVVAVTDINLLRRYMKVVFVLALFLMALVFVPHIGVVVSGSHRWIRIGHFSMQPSEFAKPVLILFIADLIDRKVRKGSDAVPVLGPLVYTVILLFLMIREPDFGSAAITAGVIFAILFLSGADMGSLIATGLSGIGAGVVLVVHSTYRFNRIKAFLNPWQHAHSGAFQIVQSAIAYGAGGLTGVGLGNSFEKLFYLPEAHTDFIFSVIAEELGFLGVAAVIGVFIFLITKAFAVAARAESIFTKTTVYGLALLIAMQVIINISVTLGLLPTKGLTIPFISYGGSSLVAQLTSIGIILNLSKKVSEGGDEADYSRWG